VRAVKPLDGHTRLFDAPSADARTVRGPHGEHLLIDRGGDVIRLDVVEGTTAAGPVALRFELADDDRLAAQLAAIRTFRATTPNGHRHMRLARRLFALQAVDARDSGASLREIADLLLGPGDWPGDGEHRKSLVRRLIAAGIRMVCSGPRAILWETNGYSSIGCTRSAGIASTD
jgi:hypothetical protein